MNSIKEMAEELSIAFRKEQGDVGYSEQLSYKLGIEAGANYVLDEVELIMKDVSDKYPRFQQGTIIHGRLIKLLEQLKAQKGEFPSSTL